MHKKTVLIFSVFVAYIIFQFLWWEVLLVKQSNEIIKEKQNVVAVSSTNYNSILQEIAELESKKNKRVYMIVGEGTVFLLILLFGIIKVRSSIRKEIEVNEQQKNFILSVSHELKTPIAASKLQLQTLIKHDLNREKQIVLLNNALEETERLNKLVENVLIANQLGNSNLTLQKEQVNLSELLEQTVDRYFLKYKTNKQLIVNVSEGAVIMGDIDLLQSVIINLIENAIKYSNDIINIEVKLVKESSKSIVLISDNGIGILANERTKIFEKFFRSGSEDTRKTKGTGIGLYLVKSICTLHGATITVLDNKPIGSVFKIEFNNGI